MGLFGGGSKSKTSVSEETLVITPTLDDLSGPSIAGVGGAVSSTVNIEAVDAGLVDVGESIALSAIDANRAGLSDSLDFGVEALDVGGNALTDAFRYGGDTVAESFD